MTVLTLAECARRITACRTAELTALAEQDEDSASAASEAYDELLEIMWDSLL